MRRMLLRCTGTPMIVLYILILLFAMLTNSGRRHINYGRITITVLRDMNTGQYRVETDAVNTRTQPDTELIGILDAHFNDRYSGFFFDTKVTKRLSARYMPEDINASHRQPGTVDRVLSALDIEVQRRHSGRLHASYQPVTRASIPHDYRLGSMDDLGTFWSAPPVIVRSRSLSSGYAANAMLAIVLGLVGLLVLRARRETSPLGSLRYAAHECSGCGYDLRGLNTDEPCPECGRSTGEPSPEPRDL